MQSGGGGDGNGAKRSDNSMVHNLEHKMQVSSGATSFEAQFRALAAGCTKPGDIDLTFKEHTVKDVSDKGREKGSERLCTALHEVLSRARPSLPKKRKADALGMSGTAGLPAHLVHAQVQEALAELRELRQPGCSPAHRSTHAAAVMRRLGQLPIDVKCLKMTKVALELNHAMWRGAEVSEDARQSAAVLVKRWRHMYKAECGLDVAVPPCSARQCKSLAMDLEEGVYVLEQKRARYDCLIDAVCTRLREDLDVAHRLRSGATTAKDLIGQVSHVFKRTRDRQGKMYSSNRVPTGRA
eukprot:NODE_13509_length_1161_cov_5.090909.p1 GENE.NODE_13509_length_1161_cov_5.090909~~NODE_13509_length_1161_cov_5.090909.p1  ORF type:complete len:297 (-),score=100.94 NODE_13509_length_1161_cov_5.090909:202-1092(-)